MEDDCTRLGHSAVKNSNALCAVSTGTVSSPWISLLWGQTWCRKHGLRSLDKHSGPQNIQPEGCCILGCAVALGKPGGLAILPSTSYAGSWVTHQDCGDRLHWAALRSRASSSWGMVPLPLLCQGVQGWLQRPPCLWLCHLLDPAHSKRPSSPSPGLRRKCRQVATLPSGIV